jgi:hypothetical protein
MPETTQEQASTLPDAPTEEVWAPTVDEIVKDDHSGRFGVYMGTWAGASWLRPVGGGTEWPVEPQKLSEATQDEKISARLKAENRRSRGY